MAVETDFGIDTGVFKSPTRFDAPISHAMAATAGWHQNVAGQPVAVIANGANVALAAGAGMVLVHNTTDNQIALYICSGGQAALVTTIGGWLTNTTTPTAGNMSMAYNGSAYAIYNNKGHSVNVASMTFRTQASAL
jgi:hypothetical protein